MKTIDIHNDMPFVHQAKDRLEKEIKTAKKQHIDVLKIIVGYGSTGGTHKIKSMTLRYLEELKQKQEIFEFLDGKNLELTNMIYLKYLYGKIPQEDCKNTNPGVIYVVFKE